MQNRLRLSLLQPSGNGKPTDYSMRGAKWCEGYLSAMVYNFLCVVLYNFNLKYKHIPGNLKIWLRMMIILDIAVVTFFTKPTITIKECGFPLTLS